MSHYSLSQETGRSPTTPSADLGMPFSVSEALLVRDMLYVFQGIDGQYVKFYEHSTVGVPPAVAALSPSSTGCFRVADGVGAGVPLSTRTMVSKLGELGWLFRRINEYLEFAVRKAGGRAGVPGAVCRHSN